MCDQQVESCGCVDDECTGARIQREVPNMKQPANSLSFRDIKAQKCGQTHYDNMTSYAEVNERVSIVLTSHSMHNSSFRKSVIPCNLMHWH